MCRRGSARLGRIEGWRVVVQNAIRPERALNNSPGHRPGNRRIREREALKGRDISPRTSSFRIAIVSPFRDLIVPHLFPQGDALGYYVPPLWG